MHFFAFPITLLHTDGNLAGCLQRNYNQLQVLSHSAAGRNNTIEIQAVNAQPKTIRPLLRHWNGPDDGLGCCNKSAGSVLVVKSLDDVPTGLLIRLQFH
jgi:hypothetical protein